MLLLKQDTNKKERVDKNIIRLKFEVVNSKKYEVEAI